MEENETLQTPENEELQHTAPETGEQPIAEPVAAEPIEAEPQAETVAHPEEAAP